MALTLKLNQDYLIVPEDNLILYYWREKKMDFVIDINEKNNLKDFIDFLESIKNNIMVENNTNVYYLYRVNNEFGFRLCN